MNLIDIESFIEKSIPIEKNIEPLLHKEAIKPDLSKLRNQHKKGKPDRRADKQEPNRRNNKPHHAPKSAKPQKPHIDSPQAKDAANLAKLEKDNKQPNNKPRRPRIPLRGRRNLEVPAVG